MENAKKFSGPRVGETVFTMFLFFKRDQYGREYTQEDIDNKRNRKPFPSYDYILTKQGFTITDHRKGIEKFKSKILKEVAKENIYSGYVRSEKDQVVLFTFGSDGKPRYIHFPEFDLQKNTLVRLIKNVTVVTPATQPMPLYNNINSPEKAKYYKRAELYKEKTAQYTGKLSNLLREQLQLPKNIQP